MDVYGWLVVALVAIFLMIMLFALVSAGPGISLDEEARLLEEEQRQREMKRRQREAKRAEKQAGRKRG